MHAALAQHTARLHLEHDAHSSPAPVSEAAAVLPPPPPGEPLPPVQLGWWDWSAYGSCRIQYLQAGTQGPPLLLVHGFGVGAYHWERNLPGLAQQHRVWAVDLLGQGGSFPDAERAPGAPPLRLSVDTWTEQLRAFVEEVVGEPVYLVGNSLGGYLGVHLAAAHPEAVRGLILCNATPFWSVRPPPGEAAGLWSLLEADGSVPVPESVKQPIQRLWWDRLRSADTIRAMLQLVYAERGALDEALVQRILHSTHHPAALDAFASIVLSPRRAAPFDAALDALRCPVLLAYGREDPWVVPLWGQRIKRRLGPAAAYLELSPAGHCPHHEAPSAVNAAISLFVRAVEAAGADGGSTGAAAGRAEDALADVLPLGGTLQVEEGPGRVVRVHHLAGAPRNVFEHADAALWRVGRAWARLAGAAAAAQRPGAPAGDA